MNYKQRQRIQIFLLILASIALFSSCTDYNKILYLKDIPDSLQTRSTKLANYKDPVIQSDDILSITILTIDPTTAAVVNQGTMAPQGSLPGPSIGSQQISGYLVDKNGNVSLPIIGQVKLAGLTTAEATALILTQTSKFYKEPNVQVRFANFKVTVLGEVTRPSTYILPNEKNTVLDALGLAGDITIYGKKDNVLLIRDSLDHKIYVRLNLNSSKTLQSPYFFLRQNDVIYVEPTKSKLVASDATQTKLFTIGVSVLTAIALILIRFK